MKSNKVGAYQQLNEMWYQDINQALGDFNTMKEVEEREPEYNKEMEEAEMEEGKNAKFFVDSDDSWDTEAESWQATLAKKGIKAKITASMGGYEITLADASQKPALEKWLSRLNLTLDPYDLEEMEEGKKKLAFVIPCPDAYDIEEEAEHFQYLLDKAGVKAKVKANQVGEEAEVYTKDEKKARKVIEKNGYQIGWNEDHEDNGQGEPTQSYDDDNNDGEEKKGNITVVVDYNTDPDDIKYVSNILKKAGIVGKVKAGIDSEEVEIKINAADKSKLAKALSKNGLELQEVSLEEKGDVKSIGDAGKMAHANTRTNLARHRSSDMLDKMSKKDHDKNTVVGAKAAAYKAPHMKEAEDDIFAGSDAAKWDNYGNETSEWDTEIAGQTVKGWTAEETQGGAIAWQNPKYPNAHIYATPGWEGVDGIAFELHDSEDGYMDEPKIQKVIGSGTEAWKTKEGYMALMAKAFTVVEKMLIPSEEMAEDDGTGRQINHDFNDDISIDPSEFEDAIQEGTQDWNHTFEEDIMDLLDDGISKPEILTHFKDILKNANPRMEESIEEDADPFGSIKTGIDQITQGDDGDMDMSDDDRFDQLGGDKIKAGIEGLMGDGFDYREILQFVKDTIASKRDY